MQRATPKAQRLIRHPGICRHARALGVSYTHLYRVLMGERQSPLRARYEALIASEKGAS